MPGEAALGIPGDNAPSRVVLVLTRADEADGEESTSVLLPGVNQLWILRLGRGLPEIEGFAAFASEADRLGTVVAVSGLQEGFERVDDHDSVLDLVGETAVEGSLH
jgi:hypothetical protein